MLETNAARIMNRLATLAHMPETPEQAAKLKSQRLQQLLGWGGDNKSADDPKVKAVFPWSLTMVRDYWFKSFPPDERRIKATIDTEDELLMNISDAQRFIVSSQDIDPVDANVNAPTAKLKDAGKQANHSTPNYTATYLTDPATIDDKVYLELLKRNYANDFKRDPETMEFSRILTDGVVAYQSVGKLRAMMLRPTATQQEFITKHKPEIDAILNNPLFAETRAISEQHQKSRQIVYELNKMIGELDGNPVADQLRAIRAQLVRELDDDDLAGTHPVPEKEFTDREDVKQLLGDLTLEKKKQDLIQLLAVAQQKANNIDSPLLQREVPLCEYMRRSTTNLHQTTEIPIKQIREQIIPVLGMSIQEVAQNIERHLISPGSARFFTITDYAFAKPPGSAEQIEVKDPRLLGGNELVVIFDKTTRKPVRIELNLKGGERFESHAIVIIPDSKGQIIQTRYNPPGSDTRYVKTDTRVNTDTLESRYENNLDPKKVDIRKATYNEQGKLTNGNSSINIPDLLIHATDCLLILNNHLNRVNPAALPVTA